MFGSANERKMNERDLSETGSQTSKYSKYSKKSANRRRIVTLEPRNAQNEKPKFKLDFSKLPNSGLPKSQAI